MSDDTADDTTQKINKTFSPINTNDRQVKQSFFQPPATIKRRTFSARQIILSCGFILLLIVFSIFLLNLLTNRNGSSTNNQIQSVFSGEELKDYTSPNNDFTILMPGVPEISNSTKKSGDQVIPITTYQRLIENDTKDYTLAVYDYSGIQLNEMEALENAMNSAIQNTPGAEIKATQIGKYNELNAIESSYTISRNGAPYEAHIRFVIKNSKMYAMILSGSDQAKFDEFANSLRLN